MQLDRSPFAGYGPELACNVQHGSVTGSHFVGDGISWPDLAEGERIIMIVTNVWSGSDVDSLSAASCLDHQGVRTDINLADQSRSGAFVRGGSGFIGGRGVAGPQGRPPPAGPASPP